MRILYNVNEMIKSVQSKIVSCKLLCSSTVSLFPLVPREIPVFKFKSTTYGLKLNVCCGLKSKAKTPFDLTFCIFKCSFVVSVWRVIINKETQTLANRSIMWYISTDFHKHLSQR